MPRFIGQYSSCSVQAWSNTTEHSFGNVVVLLLFSFFDNYDNEFETTTTTTKNWERHVHLIFQILNLQKSDWTALFSLLVYKTRRIRQQTVLDSWKNTQKLLWCSPRPYSKFNSLVPYISLIRRSLQTVCLITLIVEVVSDNSILSNTPSIPTWRTK